jgi:hypothetical protein
MHRSIYHNRGTADLNLGREIRQGTVGAPYALVLVLRICATEHGGVIDVDMDLVLMPLP